MTVQDIINWFGSNPKLVLGYFIALAIFSLLGLLFVSPKNFKPPVSYLYSGLVYGVSIPGLLSIVLIVYNFFYLKSNLLQLDIMTYYVPLVATIAILIIINKTIPMQSIPGFEKLSGLFMIIIITFIITYILQRMFFGVFFIGRFEHLLLLFLGLLIGIRIAWARIMK